MKSTVSFLCFLMILFSSACFMDGHAAEIHTSSCTDYLTSYLSAVEAFNSANETLQSVNVAVAKATGVNVPPEYKHLEDQYNSDPNGFYKTLEGMGVALPGYVSGPSQPLNYLNSPERKQRHKPLTIQPMPRSTEPQISSKLVKG
jgi:hypothetical protein